MTPRLIAAALLVAATAVPAAAQVRTPAPETTAEMVEAEVDCAATPMGAECVMEAVADGGFVYCVALDAEGSIIANSTVSSDAGLAAFNTVEADAIAGIRCRAE